MPSSSVFGEHIAMVTSLCCPRISTSSITLASVRQTANYFIGYVSQGPPSKNSGKRYSSSPQLFLTASSLMSTALSSAHRSCSDYFTLSYVQVESTSQRTQCKDGYGHDIYYTRSILFIASPIKQLIFLNRFKSIFLKNIFGKICIGKLQKYLFLINNSSLIKQVEQQENWNF